VPVTAKQTNPRALTAYRYAVVGIVPVVGLLLGPLAILLGILSWWEGGAKGQSKNGGFAAAAVILGVVEMLTNGVGLALMWIGLTSS
jgi:hypothetical protein